MTNRPHLQDEDIIGMLSEIKKSEKAEYPATLMKKRRAAFLAQAALIGAASPLSAGVKPPLRPHLPTTIEGWLTTILAVSAVAVSGLGLFTFRDELRSLLVTPVATSTRVILPQKTSAPSNQPSVSETAITTVTAQPTSIFLFLPTSTPQPKQVDPTLTAAKTKDNNGWQYGLTPHGPKANPKGQPKR